MAIEAYCVKCKSKKTMRDAKEITMKNGRPAVQGVCPDCGTKMFKIGKAKCINLSYICSNLFNV